MMVLGIFNQSGHAHSVRPQYFRLLLRTQLHTMDRDFPCPENGGGNQGRGLFSEPAGGIGGRRIVQIEAFRSDRDCRVTDQHHYN